MKTSKKLDVGCGNHPLDDAIGIDQFKYPSVDVIHDVNLAPWPLPGEHFEYIRCQHAIEHFHRAHIVAAEMHRVSIHQGIIDFITPHYSSAASWGDPTHVHHFGLPSIPLLFEQAVGKENFEVISNEIKFSGSFLDFFGWVLYKLSPRRYEKYFAWIFPASEVHTKIRVLKS